MTTIDLDRHVLEPVSMWADYLSPSGIAEPPILERPGPRFDESLGEHALLPRPARLTVGGESIYADLSIIAEIELGLAADRRATELKMASSPDGQLESMTAQGIDCALLIPTYASYLVHDETLSSTASREYARAYNRWIDDFVVGHEDRLMGAIVLSQHDPALLIQDLENVLQNRWGPVVLRPNPVFGRTLSHDAYSEFFSFCDKHSIPVALHEGTHAKVSTAGRDRFTTRFGLHACSHPLEMMMALLSLIEGGVLERNPGLRVCLLESGSSWLPFWLHRLDHIEYPHLRTEVRSRVKMPPSEYFRRNCWIAVEPGEPLLSEVLEHVGPDRFVAGSDFPHLDHPTNKGELWSDQFREFALEIQNGLVRDNALGWLGRHWNTKVQGGSQV